MIEYQIEGVRPSGDYFDVKRKDGSSFKILRPDFSDESDMMRFQKELMTVHKIDFVEVGDFMLTLIVALVFAEPGQLYRRA